MAVPEVALALMVICAGEAEVSIARILAPTPMPLLESRYIPTASPVGFGHVMIALPAVRVPDTM